MRTRAERRHHRRRRMNKAKDIPWIADSQEQYKEIKIRKFADTRKPCSCDGCGNPRNSKLFSGKSKKTMQENRMDEYEKNLGIDDD